MKDILMEIEKLKKESKELRGLALDKNVTYEDSQKIRARQNKLYDKFNFYKGFVKAVEQKGKK